MGLTITREEFTSYGRRTHPSPMVLDNGVLLSNEPYGSVISNGNGGGSVAFNNGGVTERKITYRFEDPIRSFGMEFRDFADNTGTPAGYLVATTNVGDSYTILNGVDLANNNLFFFGILNTGTPFTEITFSDTYTSDTYYALHIWFGKVNGEEEAFICP